MQLPVGGRQAYQVHHLCAYPVLVGPFLTNLPTDQPPKHDVKVSDPTMRDLTPSELQLSPSLVFALLECPEAVSRPEEDGAGKRQAGHAIKGRYTLPTTLHLLEDDDQAGEEAKKQWETGQGAHRLKETKRRKIAQEVPSVLLPSSRLSGSSSAAKSKAPPSASLAVLWTHTLLMRWQSYVDKVFQDEVLDHI